MQQRASPATTAVNAVNATSRRKPRRPTWRRIMLQLTKPLRQLFTLVLVFAWKLYQGVWGHRKRIPFVFFVYGTERDKRAYFPAWAEEILPDVFPIALMKFRGRSGRVMATFNDVNKLRESPALAVGLLGYYRKLFPNSGPVALAGQLPSLVHKAGGKLKQPFVQGTRGTRFALIEGSRALAREYGSDPKNLTIAVLGGAGYTGRLVVFDLSNIFGRVVAYDPRYTKGPTNSVPDTPINIAFTADPSELGRAEVVIVLTASGDDIDGVVDNLRRGAILGDDTHPCMGEIVRGHLEDAGVKYLKLTTSTGGKVRILPRLPNFRGDDVPGCLIEALVVAEGHEVSACPKEPNPGDYDRQHAFNEAARELGFQARLAEHTGDS